MKTAPRAMNVRQPVGTNHFQFRCHQFRWGGIGAAGSGGGTGDGKGGGGVASIRHVWRAIRFAQTTSSHGGATFGGQKPIGEGDEGPAPMHMRIDPAPERS